MLDRRDRAVREYGRRQKQPKDKCEDQTEYLAHAAPKAYRISGYREFGWGSSYLKFNERGGRMNWVFAGGEGSRTSQGDRTFMLQGQSSGGLDDAFYATRCRALP